MTIIAVWVAGSVALLFGLAGAASRSLPEPEFEAGRELAGEPSGREVELAGLHDLKPAAG